MNTVIRNINSEIERKYFWKLEAIKKNECSLHVFIPAGESRKTGRKFEYCGNCGKVKIENNLPIYLRR